MTPILALEQVSKQYPGVVALDAVNFALERGEVRALLGKNGAGKSTLVKVLSGAVHPDSGVIRIDGQPVQITDPQDAFTAGHLHRLSGNEPGARPDRGREHPAGALAQAESPRAVGHRPREGATDRQGCARSARGVDQPGPGGRSPECSESAARRDCQGAVDGTRACSCSTSRPARWPRARWMSCTRSCASWQNRDKQSST